MNSITPVRATQIVAQLLQRLDTPPPDQDAPTLFTITEQEGEAIRVLHHIAARAIVHGHQR